jgi:transglutaminase-like putative cysteine protease/tetratricopeptide (TPR) repeat protein
MFLLLLSAVTLAALPDWARLAPMEADLDVLAAEADTVETDGPVAVLLDESTTHVLADGRRVHTSRIVWQLRDAQAIANWSNTEASWSPWRQERPVIRARVRTADGTEVVLAPEQIAEGSSGTGDTSVHGDTRVLRAPLPRIEVGATVEEQIVWTDSQPFLGGTGSVLQPLPARRVAHMVRRVQVDRALDAEALVVGSDAIEVDRSRTRGDRVFTVHLEAPDLDPVVVYVPPDVPGVPVLEVRLSDDWAAVGRIYAETLAPRLDVTGLERHVEAMRALEDEEARIAYAYRLARDLRYTAVSFGEHAIVPYTPSEVLDRGYGDCKDKATLVVSLLREVGIQAHVALLRMGSDLDVSPDHPTPQRFNHAIVYLPDQDRWLDPTDARRPVDELPWRDQGRWALVIDPKAPRLIRTQERTAAVHTQRHERIYRLDPLGGASVSDRTHDLTGWRADRERADVWDLVDADETREAYTTWFEREVGGTYTRHTSTAVQDPDEPMSLTIEGEDAAFAALNGPYGHVDLGTGYAWSDAPDFLFEDDPLPAERTVDYAFVPHHGVSRQTVELPPHYVVIDQPADFRIAHGGVSMTQRTTVSDGQVVFEQVFDGGTGRMSPAEAERFRQEVAELEGEIGLVVEHAAVGPFVRGDHQEAFALLGTLFDDPETAPAAWTTAGHLLTELGLKPAALRAGQRAVDLAPGRSGPLTMVAEALSMDRVGRRWQMPFDRDASLAAWEAVAAVDDGPIVRQNLAAVRSIGTDGATWGSGVDYAALVEDFAALREAGETEEARDHEVRAHIGAGDCRTARALAEEWDLGSAERVAAVLCASGPDLALRTAADHASSQAERGKLVDAALLISDLTSPDRETAAAHRDALCKASENPDACASMAVAMRRGPDGWRQVDDFATRTFLGAMVGLATDPETPPAGFHPDIPVESLVDLMARFGAAGLPASWLVDGIAANLETETEGSKRLGTRTTLQFPWATVRLHATWKDRAWLLRGMSGEASMLLDEASERLDAGDVKGGLQWTVWAAEEGIPPRERALYTEPEDADEARRMIALLRSARRLAGPDDVAVLERWIDDEPDEERKAAVREATVRAATYGREPFPEVVERVSAPLEASRRAWNKAIVLQRVGRPEEALAQLDEGEVDADRKRVELLLEAGRVDEGLQLFDGADPSDSGHLNNVAWRLLFADEPARWERAFALANTALQKERADPSVLHTYALAAAMLGDLTAAQRARSAAGSSAPLGDHWWAVDGWMLHHLGLPEDAREAFDRVPTPAATPVPTVDLIPARYRGG